MKTFLLGALVVAVGGLSACASRYADAPAPTRFANATQQKVQAASHWQMIAEHVAGQLNRDLSAKLNGRSLFVPQPGGEQPFVEGFRELLITALVAQGLPVAIDPRGALAVDVRYSIYRFRPDRLKDTYYFGEATALAAGLWAVGGVVAATANASPPGVAVGATLLTVAAAADGFGWAWTEAHGSGKYASGPAPRSEILLTATVADGGRIVSRASNIYYTADEDDALYWNRASSAYSGGGLVSVVGDCGGGRTTCGR